MGKRPESPIQKTSPALKKKRWEKTAVKTRPAYGASASTPRRGCGLIVEKCGSALLAAFPGPLHYLGHFVHGCGAIWVLDLP
jgi:hypothetical protein